MAAKDFGPSWPEARILCKRIRVVHIVVIEDVLVLACGGILSGRILHLVSRPLLKKNTGNDVFDFGA